MRAQAPVLTGTAGDRQVTLNWTYSGPAEIVGWDYRQAWSGNQNSFQIPGATASTRTYTVTGLANGTSYTFLVYGYDSNDEISTPDSNSVAVTPRAVPVLVSDPDKTVPALSGGTVLVCYNLLSVSYDGTTYLEKRPGKTPVQAQSVLRDTTNGVAITEAPDVISSLVVGVGNINFNPCATVGVGAHTVTWAWNGPSGTAPKGETSTTFTVTDPDKTITVSASDASVTEGDSGRKNVVVTVTLGASPDMKNLTLAVDPSSSATGGSLGASSPCDNSEAGNEEADFCWPNGSGFSFRGGSIVRRKTTKTLQVLGDRRDEGDETIKLVGSSPGWTSGSVTITITDDDGDSGNGGAKTITLSTSSASVTEGNSGTKDVVVTGTLGEPAPVGGMDVRVVVDSSSSATAGSQGATDTCDNSEVGNEEADFCWPNADWLQWDEGQTVATATLQVVGDTRDEGDETIKLVGSSSGWTSGSVTITITDDDGDSGNGGAKTITLSTSSASVTEGNSGTKDVVVTGTLGEPAPVGGMDVRVVVDSSSSATAGSQGATDTCDNSEVGNEEADFCWPNADWLQWDEGQTVATATLQVVGDTRDEGDETIKLVGSSSGWTSGSVTITIKDDDGASGGGDSGGGGSLKASFRLDARCVDGLCRARTGGSVSFEDTSAGTVSSRTWSFGDGKASRSRAPRHVWAVPGFYTVSLTVSGGGRSDTASRTVLVEAADPAGSCAADSDTRCLQQSRFSLAVDWWTADGEARRAGKVVRVGTDDSALFRFFSPTNWELLLKVLDGCSVNGHVWVFGASATTLGYSTQVTDTVTGAMKEYRNEPGSLSAAITDNTAFPGACSGAGATASLAPSAAGDSAFPGDLTFPGDLGPAVRLAAAAPVVASPVVAAAGGACTGDAGTLCLLRDRYAVSVDWSSVDGATGRGSVARPRTDDSGLFWFFSPTNWELLVKVLNGCSTNRRHWVFAASATDVGFVLTVRDTVTGQVKQYTHAAGTPAKALADVSAFPEACGP